MKDDTGGEDMLPVFFDITHSIEVVVDSFCRSGSQGKLSAAGPESASGDFREGLE